MALWPPAFGPTSKVANHYIDKALAAVHLNFNKDLFVARRSDCHSF